MNDISRTIQTIAKKRLSDGTVEAVIGFKNTNLAYLTQPFIARTSEEATKLIFNSHCRLNLATYLPGSKGKTAIVVKGCDSRNLVTQIIENRVKRDQVYIIGVPCTGMVDKQKILGAAGGQLVGLADNGTALELVTGRERITLKREECLQENCKTCISRNPVICDELAGPNVPELELENRFWDVEKIEAMDAGEKQAYFDDLFENCIRCYACRNACPLCFCPTCFVDESRPQWVGKTTQNEDVKTFHLLRAFHDAGRCTDCGACESACPMGIKVRAFTRKTIRDCVEYYNSETGMSENQRPVLDRFSTNDPEDYIL